MITMEFNRPQKNYYFPELTGLRGWAAIVVMLFHISLFSPTLPQVSWITQNFIAPFYYHGNLGVYLFFVLSGFLLSFYFLSAYEKDEKPKIKKFALNRCLRILPLYYFQLSLLIFFSWFSWGQSITFKDVLLHFFLLGNSDFYLVNQFNPVYWTLTVECCFYVALPILAFGLRHGFWKWLLLLAVIIGMTSRWLISTSNSDQELFLIQWKLNHFPSTIDFFIFGMIAAYWRFHLPNTALLIRFGDFIMVSSAIIIAVFIYSVDWFVYWGENQAIKQLFLALSIALFVFGVSARGRLARVIWSNSIMVKIGILSYSIYLWHSIVIRLFDGSIFHGWKLRNWLWHHEVTADGTFMIVTFVVVFLTLVVSYFSYRFIEQPFLNLKYKILIQ